MINPTNGIFSLIGTTVNGASLAALALDADCSAQQDSDGDGVPDLTDNCLNTPNAGQKDLDGNTVGDACDPNTIITTNTVLTADTTLAGDLTVDGATLTIQAGRTLGFDFVNNKIIIKFPDSKILIEIGGKIT